MKAARSLWVGVLIAALFAVACGGDGGSNEPTATGGVTQAPTEAATPTPGAPTEVRIPNVEPATAITLPAGFAAYPIATGFVRATSVAPAPDGSIFVSQRHGEILRLVDANGDGVFEQSGSFTSPFSDDVTGIMVAPDGTIYVSSRGKVTTVRDTNGDGSGDESQAIITGLPNGRHQNNGLAIGPDGKLYITNGSTCDDCSEEDPRSASIFQADADGGDLRVYAHGLRNPYDIAFDAQGRLWATDNGSDAPCATNDELNLIVDGGDYGWPYAADGCNALTDGTPPVADLGLHTAATGVTVYTAGQFPAQYRGNLFATVWGSFFATPEPYDRVLLNVSVQNDTGIVDTFASGFTHPIDVFADSDGSLLVLDYGSDDVNARDGTLYRVIYSGG